MLWFRGHTALPLYSCVAEVNGDVLSHLSIANENCSDPGSSCPQNERTKKSMNGCSNVSAPIREYFECSEKNQFRLKFIK